VPQPIVAILLIVCGVAGQYTARDLFTGEIGLWYWLACSLMMFAGLVLLAMRIGRWWRGGG
jgi:hypothetical protein